MKLTKLNKPDVQIYILNMTVHMLYFLMTSKLMNPSLIISLSGTQKKVALLLKGK